MRQLVKVRISVEAGYDGDGFVFEALRVLDAFTTYMHQWERKQKDKEGKLESE